VAILELIPHCAVDVSGQRSRGCAGRTLPVLMRDYKMASLRTNAFTSVFTIEPELCRKYFRKASLACAPRARRPPSPARAPPPPPPPPSTPPTARPSLRAPSWQARLFQRALREGADAFSMHLSVVGMKKERHSSHRRAAPSQYVPL